LHNSNEPGPTSHAMVAAVPSANAQQSDRLSEAKAVPAAATPSRLADEERSLARAGALVRQGDILGARLWLEHAVESGSARSAFVLAETYDAHMLASWGTYGVRENRPKALELYALAYSRGMPKAKERIEALQ
jgi:TPR repeat protein